MSLPLTNLYQVRLFYQFSGLEHRFQSWLMPSSFTTTPTGDWNDYSLETFATIINADTWVDELVDEYKKLHNGATTFNQAELWAYNSGDLNAEFLAAKTLSDVGTLAGTAIPASQTIFTSRTASGRVKKFTVEENSFPVAAPISWDSVGANPLNVWGTYVLSSNGRAMVDREGARVVALNQVFQGQNEAVFKRRYRFN